MPYSAVDIVNRMSTSMVPQKSKRQRRAAPRRFAWLRLGRSGA